MHKEMNNSIMGYDAEEKMHAFKYIDLFAGIGGLRTPFQNLGGECVFSSEIDKYAAQAY